METTTPFDLNQAIQRWRDNLGQAPALRGENLVELESHLRDSVTGLEAQGLSAEEAFMVSSQRIGKVDLLGAEFEKVSRGTVWIDRLLWMLIGLQIWALVSGPVGLISNVAVSLGLVGGNFDFATHGRALPVMLFALVRLLALVGSLTICWWLIVRKGQSFASRIERFLNGWARLAMICCTLCLISCAVSALGGLSWTVLLKFAGPQMIGKVLTSQNYSNAFTWLFQTGAFIFLSLILARKRLQLSKA